MISNLPIYELMLDQDNDGVYCISLVDRPAIEQDFLVFDAQEELQFTKVDEEKHIVYGPAMIPDMLIYRKDQRGREYYVKFSKETIAQIAEKFHRDNCLFNISLAHEVDVKDCFVFTSYIIDRENGIDPIQFKNVADGTWIVGVKVENDKVWDMIKNTDLLRGFSVEIIATPHKMSKTEPTNQEVPQEGPKHNWLENILSGHLIIKEEQNKEH